MTKIGIACPLPPARGGPADYVSHLLPFLSRDMEVICLAPDPDAVEAHVAGSYEIRAIDRVADRDLDLVLYHIANNSWHRSVVEAAREGPPGLAVVHDATVHNIYYDLFLHEGARDRYRTALEEAHGPVGASLANVRMTGETGDVELYLFDLLEPLLTRQLGAIVHSRFARDFVSERVPGLPVWVIPHYAIGDPCNIPRDALGVPADRFAVTHLGVVTRSKRPDLLLAAATELLADDVPLHVVFAGQDLSGGLLEDAIGGLGIREHVTVTGFVSEQELDAHACAADVVVSLRWPHMGESSGTLMRAFRAGKPVVMQRLGTWAELPPYASVSIPDGPDEVSALARVLETFRADPRLRRRTGDAARLYAASIGGPERAAQQYARSVRELLAIRRRSPFDVLTGRRDAVEAHLATDRSSIAAVLGAVPPAHPGARLLLVGRRAGVRDALSAAWGYTVDQVANVDACHDGAGSFDAVVMLDAPEQGLPSVNRLLRHRGLLVGATGRPAAPDAGAAGLSDPVPIGGSGDGWSAYKVTLPSLELAPVP